MNAGVCAPGQPRHEPVPRRAEDLRGHRAAVRARAKMFEVREMESDVSFLRNYLTEELVQELDLYVYKVEDDELAHGRQAVGAGAQTGSATR